MLTIAQVNALDDDAFVHAFGAVYEDSPHLAAKAAAARPFASRAELLAAFDRVAAELAPDDALALLRAHPVLGQKGPMAKASEDEQSSAGLRDIEAERQERLRVDNARYLEKFGFPFIIAVRGLGVADIDAALTRRLQGTPDDELATALGQVRRIAALRLEQLVEE